MGGGGVALSVFFWGKINKTEQAIIKNIQRYYKKGFFFLLRIFYPCDMRYRFIIDSIRTLQYIHAYTWYTHWSINGQYMMAKPYIWLPNQTFDCRTKHLIPKPNIWLSNQTFDCQTKQMNDCQTKNFNGQIQIEWLNQTFGQDKHVLTTGIRL